ncbi:ATPase subunit of ABC transporter with duplicated ATPase domains [Sphingomonas leidyi]|uniref:ATPase subunit of ABC transporter with duplicated ATPase domains n=1 Tax=Sphingomonas leidyi TaxID=68569 RepID=A0A7X5V3V3_9SPHN|nr:ATP-binding cassette domain-containing protein [Sphingomonas leidyi]NIJ67404.1 ATPase subunit of ABC transporter with duplicated ATPase domains [Sphingomonas leidyi]
MSCFVTLDSLSAATPEGRPLFDDLTLALGRERTGLAGRNGSGKSTLLGIVAGEMPPVVGNVTRAGSIGVLRQEWPGGWNVDEVLGVREGLAQLARVLAGEGSAEDLAEADWTLEERVAAALAEAGLDAMALDRRVATLSGGERTRVGIARLRLDAPDLLLLDEPTNNLDAAGRAAVAALVDGWRGGVLVASHDRELLEHMDRIVELTPRGVRVFGGGWSGFAAARAAERARAAAEVERAGDLLRGAEAGAQQARERQARRDRAGRAYAASGSAPKILLGRQKERAENSAGRGAGVGERLVGDAEARLVAARAGVEVVTPLVIDLPATGLPANRRLLAFEDAALERAGRVFGPWRFEITGPERVAVTGPNGAGKTSLLRMAAGVLAPERGAVRRAEGRVAMLDQHVGLLDPRASVLDNFRRLHPGATEREAHAACARFAFRNRDALKRTGDLSGGERLRAGLACVLGGEIVPQLLLLDEPTNHLDMESIEVIEAALAGFDGALLVVSHDRAFLEAIGAGREIAVGR